MKIIFCVIAQIKIPGIYSVMKILIALLSIAGTLSVPSVVFAEANWYGSLRAGVESSDGNIAVKDGESYWGIQGSTDAGESLATVYQFEQNINIEDAGQPGGRLSYVGLSGAFGSLTVGRIWSASYNTVGVITDNSYHYGDSQTSYRHGHAISYAFSNDLMTLQIDAISSDDNPDEENDEENRRYNYVNNEDNERYDFERVEFGLSVNVGDIGKVAAARIDKKHKRELTQIVATIDRQDTIAAEVSVSDIRVYVGVQKHHRESRSTVLHGIADWKTNFFGFAGGLGDTGIDFVFQWRDTERYAHKPWILGLSKSLGEDVSINLEHANNDGDSANATRVTLRIDF